MSFARVPSMPVPMAANLVTGEVGSSPLLVFGRIRWSSGSASSMLAVSIKSAKFSVSDGKSASILRGPLATSRGRCELA